MRFLGNLFGLRALALVFAVVSVGFVTGAGAAELCGQLAGVKGTTVEILRMQRGRGAKDTVRYAMKITEKTITPLECDDVVLAGKDSSARVLLANAKLSLGSDSRIEIAQHSAAKAGETANVSLLNLTYGKLRALVNRKTDENGESVTTAKGPAKGAATPKSGADSGKNPQATFEIKTFSAVAGVRGTDFYVSYDLNSGVTDQATIEGAVEVAQAGTNQKALIEAGKQVTVETTPQAVRQAQERIRTGKLAAGEKANELPKKLPTSEVVKPLVVVAMNEVVKNELRRTSAAVSDDADFTSKKAVETLGAATTWTLKREELPANLKNLKNEY